MVSTTRQFRSAQIGADDYSQIDYLQPNFTFVPGRFDVPACAITNLDSDVIYASNAVPSDMESDPEETPQWSLTGAKTTVTRFWSSSTAYFTMSCKLLDGRSRPPALPPYLRMEQEVCLYMGYLENLRPVTLDDLAHSRNIGKPYRLKRVYTGIIEVVSVTFTATGGYMASFQCRDRMKWLMDTTTTFNPNARAEQLISKETATGFPKGPQRSDLILQCARRGIGQTDVPTTSTTVNQPQTEEETSSEDTTSVDTSELKEKSKSDETSTQETTEEKVTSSGPDKAQTGCGCGRDILKSEKFLYDAANSIASDQKVLDLNAWYRNNGPLQNKLVPSETNDPKNNPEFRIFTTRDTLNTDEKQEFLVANQVPAEMVKFLAMQEVFPTEVFQHHEDGNFYYTPRMNDSSGLEKPELFYRTYFCKYRPDIPPGIDNFESDEVIGGEVDAGIDTTGASEDTEVETGIDTSANTVAKRASAKRVFTNSQKTRGVNLENDESAEDPPEESKDPDVITKEERDKSYEKARSNSSRSFNAAVALNNVNQHLIRFKEESTSIGLKTNILVRSSSSNVSGSLGKYMLHLRTRPYSLKRPDPDGSTPNFACKFAIYQDVTIANTTEAAVIALTLARILGKETRAATGVLLGDPTLSPGEVCQVVASPFQYSDTTDDEFVGQMKADRAKYFAFENNSVSVGVDYINALKTAKGAKKTNGNVVDLPVFDGTTAEFENQEGSQENSDTLLCEAPSRIYSADDKDDNEGLKDRIGYNQEPQSLWRVDAVIHNFNMGSKGYTSEVAWTSPF